MITLPNAPRLNTVPPGCARQIEVHSVSVLGVVATRSALPLVGLMIRPDSVRTGVTSGDGEPTIGSCPKVGLIEIVLIDLAVQRSGAVHRIGALVVVWTLGTGGSIRDEAVRTSAKLWLSATRPSRWHQVWLTVINRPSWPSFERYRTSPSTLRQSPPLASARNSLR